MRLAALLAVLCAGCAIQPDAVIVTATGVGMNDRPSLNMSISGVWYLHPVDGVPLKP